MSKAQVLLLALSGTALLGVGFFGFARDRSHDASALPKPSSAGHADLEGEVGLVRDRASSELEVSGSGRQALPNPNGGERLVTAEISERETDSLVVARRSISGRVLWPDGSPAAGVAMRAELDPFTLGDETSTSAEGDFALAVRGEGPFRVVAEADRQGEASSASGGSAGPVERFSASAPGIAPGTVGLRHVLDPGFVLGGRVRDDLGAPLDAFAIQAIPFGRGREVSRSFREAHGVFELGGLGPGSWVVVAHAPDHGKAERIERTLPGDAGALDFVLPRAGEIRGVVLGPDDAPVGSAEVLLDGGSRPGARRARTDAEGRFVFERATAGPCRLVAWSEALPESEPVELDLRAGETAGSVVLRLPAR